MRNQFDIGMQEDFDNMTIELGREVTVYSRLDVLTYEGQEGTGSGLGSGVTEVVFLQELDTQNEMISAGEMAVGDVRFSFKHNSIVEEEGYVSPDLGITNYKVLKLTKVKGQSNNSVTYIKAFGKKIPNR